MSTLAPLPIEVEPYETKDMSTDIGGKHHQWVYKFANGYGASVITGRFTYGGPQGLYELAVLDFNTDPKGALTYKTPITSDVIGHLTVEGVAALLVRIGAL